MGFPVFSALDLNIDQTLYFDFFHTCALQHSSSYHFYFRSAAPASLRWLPRSCSSSNDEVKINQTHALHCVSPTMLLRENFSTALALEGARYRGGQGGSPQMKFHKY